MISSLNRPNTNSATSILCQVSPDTPSFYLMSRLLALHRAAKSAYLA